MYPAALLADSLKGEVRIRVTVLPSGRADPKTLVVVSSTHPLFTRAVEDALPRLEFLPAEVGGTMPPDCHPNPPYPPTCEGPHEPGRKVAQQVELTFDFVPPPSAQSADSVAHHHTTSHR